MVDLEVPESRSIHSYSVAGNNIFKIFEVKINL